jgi:SAM-dependent methyltransferase
MVGVEPDAEGVRIARQKCPQATFYKLAVDDGPAQVLADYPQGFDAVVSTEVIEHLYAPRQLAAFAHGVLRDGGHLVLTTPHHGYLKNLAISLVNGWDRHADPLWDGGPHKAVQSQDDHASARGRRVPGNPLRRGRPRAAFVEEHGGRGGQAVSKG